MTSPGRNVVRGFDTPDERRTFPGGFLDLVSVGPLTFGRDTLQPGWRWSTDVKPIVGTERCEHHHVGYQLVGRTDGGRQLKLIVYEKKKGLIRVITGWDL